MVMNRAIGVDVLGMPGVLILCGRFRLCALTSVQPQHGGNGEEQEGGSLFREVHRFGSFDRMVMAAGLFPLSLRKCPPLRQTLRIFAVNNFRPVPVR